MSEIETHRGIVGRVFFAKPDGPFMAGILKLEEGGEIRFSGKVAASQGDRLEVTGKWGHHQRFGEQFEVETGIVKMNESPDALAHLLATHEKFKGLGPVRARKVVEAALHLSTDGEVASALAAFPAEIAARAKCPLEVVQNAALVWNERRTYFDALARLVEQGWSNAQAQQIVHVFGENAPSIVKGDPYGLIGKVPRFGFRTVDAVARKMGIAPTDPARLLAGVAYCLDEIASDGNTWTTRDDLIAKSIQELRPDTLSAEAAIDVALQGLIDRGVVHLDRSPLDTELVADARTAGAEFQVFERVLAGLVDESCGTLSLDGPRAVEVLATLNEGQAKAVRAFSRFAFGVVSGGAGVGKTYTMRSICEIAEENGVKVALCAPTGKAAKKLGHATGRKAKTIHRLLAPAYDEHTGLFRFTHHQGNPLPFGLVVVDEFSMVDVKLGRSLLSAVAHGTRVLFVGDHHQIPSVGAGAILRDTLSVRAPHNAAVHVLTEIVRQAGVLARNTTALLDGVVSPQDVPCWRIRRTERGHEEATAAIVAEEVELLVASIQLEPFGRALDFSWDVQVLAPMRKGPLGTYNLNIHLQRLRRRLLGKEPPPETKPDHAPAPLEGDRVIWTENDYELELFNGTQGVVTKINQNGSLELFTEDGCEVTIPPGKRKNIEVAYAMTIHKCVAGDTMIETGGGWSRIDELVAESGTVATTLGAQRFERFIERKEGELLTVECEGGYRLKVTPDHKLRRFDGERWCWVQASELSPGDFLRMKLGDSRLRRRASVKLPPAPHGDVRARKIRVPARLTADVAEFFGLMVADGTRHHRGIRLAKRHVEVVDRFVELGERLFGLTAHRFLSEGTPAADFNSTILSEWLWLVGGMDPNAKFVPRPVLSGSREVRASFLRGLFEDGTVNVKRGLVGHVEWMNSNPELVRLIQTLLLEFGIISSIALGRRTPALYIHSSSVTLFRDSIGFVACEKNRRLRLPISKTTRSRVPVARRDFTCATFVGQNARARGYVSRDKAEALGMKDELEYHYPRVVSVDRERGKSYCLSVPHGRAFLQNRFDGSNSQGSEWPAVVLVISSSHWIMRDRNLLYTGASRAAEGVVIVGDMGGIRGFAEHRRSASRQTFGKFLVHGWRPTMREPLWALASATPQAGALPPSAGPAQ